MSWHAPAGGWQNCECDCIIASSHLTHQQYTLAAIDDVIARGKRQDWAELRTAALADRSVLEKVLRVCEAHVADPYAQPYHFWKQYTERYLACTG